MSVSLEHTGEPASQCAQFAALFFWEESGSPVRKVLGFSPLPGIHIRFSWLFLLEVINTRGMQMLGIDGSVTVSGISWWSLWLRGSCSDRGFFSPWKSLHLV